MVYIAFVVFQTITKQVVFDSTGEDTCDERQGDAT